MFKIGSARSPHSPENLPPETGHSCLTYGNVAASLTPGNHTAETALAGWGGRIRTSASLALPTCSLRQQQQQTAKRIRRLRPTWWPLHDRTTAIFRAL